MLNKLKKNMWNIVKTSSICFHISYNYIWKRGDYYMSNLKLNSSKLFFKQNLWYISFLDLIHLSSINLSNTSWTMKKAPFWTCNPTNKRTFWSGCPINLMRFRTVLYQVWITGNSIFIVPTPCHRQKIKRTCHLVINVPKL